MRSIDSRSIRASLSLSALLFFSPGVLGQGITTQVVASGLSSPLDLESPPGDSRLFIAEQTGRIKIVENGVVLSTPYFNGASLVASSSFTGLRGLAFHPDYASNGYVYIAYDTVTSGAGDVVIDRLTVDGSNPNVVDPSSRVEILRVTQTAAWHGGGDMAFGTDGYFYTAYGDGHGTGGDQFCSAQDGSKMLGKMIRIDLDSAFPYAIPADNPFVGNAAVRDEVWALGMRHPWRWSFDAANGDIYIADVGQSGQEEIDYIGAGTSGQNFGWKVMEGTSCFSTSGCSGVLPCNNAGYTDPILTQSTSLNCSITGGFVYRGAAIPSEQGNYFFAGYCSGSIWSFSYDGSTTTGYSQRNGDLGVTVNGITSFGQDAFGELYTIQQNGTVRKIIPVCGVPTAYCTGATNSTGNSASIGYFGSYEISDNNFNASVSGVVGSVPGLFFFAPNQISVPFGNGFLCAGGGINRMPPPVLTDFLGTASYSLDLTSAPGDQITAGSTWNFQFWYRDVAAGGAMFNTSNGLSVDFCP